MASKQSFEQIMTVLESYFEGLYQADSDILKPLFHADARYINTVAGDYMNYSMIEYFTIVRDRRSPATHGQLREDHIISLEFDGQNMGYAKLSMTMLGRKYLDYLTLMYSDNRWQIVSKVFSYKPLQGNT